MLVVASSHYDSQAEFVDENLCVRDSPRYHWVHDYECDIPRLALVCGGGITVTLPAMSGVQPLGEHGVGRFKVCLVDKGLFILQQ